MSDQEIFRQRGAYLVPDVAPSVTSKWAKGTGGPAGDECQNLVVFENHAQDSRVREMGDVFSTVSTKYGTGGGNTPIVVHLQRHYVVRRLTPRECERLQGFPDDWTNILGASDSARYKALGNSVAIPCVEFIMGQIAAALREV